MNLNTRSGRERGLHQRAVRSGVAFPCPITWITLPMKTAPDDDNYELTPWPVLGTSMLVPRFARIARILNT